ncbi:MAG: hypothetical protein ACR2IP_03530 [Solirubrobacteraceae bacterium]
MRLLIETGADPSAPARRGNDGPSETPLHWAASSDEVEVATALIDGGADIEARGASIAADPPPTQEELNVAFWQACHGGSAADGRPAAGARRGHQRDTGLQRSDAARDRR